MQTNRIQQIRDRLWRCEKVSCFQMVMDVDDIRILLEEIDRLTATCVECEDCYLQARTMSWKDNKKSSQHDGKRCRVAYYLYGQDSVTIAGYDYGVIVSGDWGNRRNELIGYAVKYDFDFRNETDKEHFASLQAVQIL